MENIERRWWKEAVVYQIYPRSFNDSDNDGIGDIRGITEKLDYLKELGVDVVWVSPFFASPLDDNGYDISDYRKVHEDLGTMEDIEELIEGLHARGMKILIDLVVNHTSDEHPWFQESRKSRDNRYSDYYIWKDEPNDWESVFSGPAWEYSKERDQYYLHVFSRKQPDLNWENEKVREEVYDIMRFWIDKGCDGFRMDVINLISKKFRDAEYQGEEYFFNGPKVHEYLQEMNEKVLKGRNLMTVGECPGASIDDAMDFAGLHDRELNMIFTFEHMDVDSGDGKWDYKDFDLVSLKGILSRWQESLHGKAWNSIYMNNHDQPRMVSRFGDDGRYWRQSAKMLGHVIHTMEGTPYIYQGEELGMTNVPLNIPEDLKDLESINAYTDLTERGVFSVEHMNEAIRRKARDNARTPMQWNTGANGGFTEGNPWMKVNPNYVTINAESESQDEDSILTFYKNLISARREHPVLVYGEFREIEEYRKSPELYIFTRTLGNTMVLSINSFSRDEKELDIKGLIKGLYKDNGENGRSLDILHSSYRRVVAELEEMISLSPYECLSLILSEEDNLES